MASSRSTKHAQHGTAPGGTSRRRLTLGGGAVAGTLVATVGLIGASAGAASAAPTVTVNETAESATFSAPMPDGTPSYSSSITDVSNHNGLCSLREAVEAANTGTAVDGCAAGQPGSGTTIVLPAGTYHVDDNLFVTSTIHFVGANAGVPGGSAARGAESVIQMDHNPNWRAQVAMIWLNGGQGDGIATGGASTFDGVTLQGPTAPTCDTFGTAGSVPCEVMAIVQPTQAAGIAQHDKGFTVENSIVQGWTTGMYLGGDGGRITDNLFRDNNAYPNDVAAARGVDIYSDGVYPTANTLIQHNVFANPAAAAIDLEEKESGLVIDGNRIEVPTGAQAGATGMYLFATHDITVTNNAILGVPTSPPTLPTTTASHRGIELSNSQNLTITGNTVVGFDRGIDVRDWQIPGDGVLSNVNVNHNRIYDNTTGINVLPADASSFAAGTVIANDNWWGANGGPGSTGARVLGPAPAATTVNGIVYHDPSGAVVPTGDAVTVDSWLKLTCSLTAQALDVNGTGTVTGAVPGMPSLNHLLGGTEVHPVMASGVTGGVGTLTGLNAVPDATGSTSGTFTATTAGAGSVDVALDSEQVACPVTVNAVAPPVTDPPAPAPTTPITPTTPTTPASRVLADPSAANPSGPSVSTGGTVAAGGTARLAAGLAALGLLGLGTTIAVRLVRSRRRSNA